MSDGSSASEPRGSTSCPKCSSARVRRSKPRAGREKLLHSAGVHFYRCQECRYRWRRLSLLDLARPQGSTASERARLAARQRTVTVVAAVVVAVLLGVGAGVFLNGSG